MCASPEAPLSPYENPTTCLSEPCVCACVCVCVCVCVSTIQVYGVTAKTLRALSSLLGLQHLEIIDSRDLHGRARAAPGGADGDAAEAQQSYAASWYNWLFGTGTGEEEKGSKQSGAAHPHTGNDLVLHAGDIGELANLTALRHLQVGVLVCVLFVALGQCTCMREACYSDRAATHTHTHTARR